MALDKVAIIVGRCGHSDDTDTRPMLQKRQG
jgi:hypothetical protein